MDQIGRWVAMWLRIARNDRNVTDPSAADQNAGVNGADGGETGGLIDGAVGGRANEEVKLEDLSRIADDALNAAKNPEKWGCWHDQNVNEGGEEGANIDETRSEMESTLAAAKRLLNESGNSPTNQIDTQR